MAGKQVHVGWACLQRADVGLNFVVTCLSTCSPFLRSPVSSRLHTSADACHYHLQAELMGPGAMRPAHTFMIQAVAGGAGLQGGSAAGHSSLDGAANCQQPDLQAMCEGLRREVLQATAAAEQERRAAQKAQAMAHQEKQDNKAAQQQLAVLQQQQEGLHQALEDARRQADSAAAELTATRSTAAQEQARHQAMCASLTAQLEAANTWAQEQKALHASLTAELRGARSTAADRERFLAAELEAARATAQEQQRLHESAVAEAAAKAEAEVAQLQALQQQAKADLAQLQDQQQQATAELAQLRAQRQDALDVCAAAEAAAKSKAELAQQQEALRVSAVAEAAAKAEADLAQLRSQTEGAEQALLRQVAALQEEPGEQSASAAATQSQNRALQDLVRLLEGDKGRLRAEADKNLKRAQHGHANELQSVFQQVHAAQASSQATEQRLRDRVDRLKTKHKTKLRTKKVSSEPVGCVGGVGVSLQGLEQRMELHVVAALWCV